jgi:tRNA (cytidine/uridine-2'-O-)-methyltransferase
MTSLPTSKKPTRSALPVLRLNVVLVEPEIPPNTGNIIRLCANTGAQLHLIEPLGFPLDSAKMRRAGLDYHEFCDIQVHSSWDAFWEKRNVKAGGCGENFAFTTKGQRTLFDCRIQPGSWLFFGPETRGLSEEQRNSFPEEQRLRIPMRPESRSLNLSNSVAVAVYEAWRQQVSNH